MNVAKDNKLIKRLRVGMKIKVIGKVKYRQDFSGWEGDFPEVVFTVFGFIKPDYIWLKGYGYGARNNYGNGQILISKKYKSQMRKVK